MSDRFRLDGDEAGNWFVQELVCHDDEWVTRCTCTSRETALEIVERNNAADSLKRDDGARWPALPREYGMLRILLSRLEGRAKSIMQLETAKRNSDQHSEASDYCLQRLAVGNCISDLEDVLREHGGASSVGVNQDARTTAAVEVVDQFLNLPIADPIPRQNVLDAVTRCMAKFTSNNHHAEMVAREVLIVMQQPGMPCGHARSFFFQSENGETGCVACDMWEDAFAK